jgi:hypothetical protein
MKNIYCKTKFIGLLIAIMFPLLVSAEEGFTPIAGAALAAAPQTSVSDKALLQLEKKKQKVSEKELEIPVKTNLSNSNKK